MSRAQRYNELLAAAALADRDLALEAARGQRAGQRDAALIGLVPALARAGISIGGQVVDAQKLEAANDLATRKLDVAEAAAASREASAAQRAADAASRADRDFTFRTEKEQRDALKDARTDVMPSAVAATRDLDRAPNWRRFVGDIDENPARLVGPPTREQAVAGDADGFLSRKAADVSLSRSELETRARESRRGEDTKLAQRDDDIARRERFHADSMNSAAAGRASAAAERALTRDLIKGKQEKEDNKVTNAQADDIVALDEASNAMARIGNEAKKLQPNVLKEVWNTANDKLGLSTDLTGYVATIRNFNSAVGVLRSGSAIGVAEQKRLDSFLVQAGDTVSVVEAKKKAFTEWIADKRGALNRARELQGLPALPFGSSSSTSVPAGSTSFQAD